MSPKPAHRLCATIPAFRVKGCVTMNQRFCTCLLFGLLLGIALPVVAQTPAERLAAISSMLSPDERAEVEAQAAHANPRMRFKLLNSWFNPRPTLWQAFAAELDAFGESQYERLKPLILEADIPSLQQAVADGRLSYSQLTTFYLYRIRKFESDDGRYLNALISLNPAAIEAAREKDRQLGAGDASPATDSIFGMPILLKDNIGFAGLPTTAGALALQANDAGNAFISSRLLGNGAIIIGKANLSEWAYYFCDGCPLGYSAMGGQTLNPYGRKILESGGSSSGSAVSVAANYAVAAVGSETSGSILSPSSLNSVVGLKPTTGLLSRSGIVPISSSLDTPGPIARSVVDAVILFNSMSGYDQDDLAMPLRSADVTLQAGGGSLAGRRLGYFAALGDNPDYLAIVELLRQAGAELVEIAARESTLQGFSEFLGGEMKRDLAHYLRSTADADILLASVDAIADFNRINLESRAPYGQGRFEAMEQMTVSDGELQAVREALRATALSTLESPMQALALDAIVSMNNFHAGVAAAANYPALTVPMGLRENGEPFGVTLLAPGFSEQLLVELALGIEALGARRVLPADYQ